MLEAFYCLYLKLFFFFWKELIVILTIYNSDKNSKYYELNYNFS